MAISKTSWKRGERPPGAGRKKGTPNKITRAFREATVTVYNSIGGDAAYAKWATENPTQFYQIASKMIPTEVSGPEGGPIRASVNWNDTFAAPSTESHVG